VGIGALVVMVVMLILVLRWSPWVSDAV